MRSPDGLLPEDALVFEIAALRVSPSAKIFAGRQNCRDRAHFDLCPRGLAPSRPFSILPPATMISVPATGVRFAGRHRKRETLAMLGSASPRIQGPRLPPDRRLSGFARGVALEGKQRIVAIHSGAVIDDTNERNTAAPDADLDLARRRRHAVLDQSFTTDAGRSITSPPRPGWREFPATGGCDSCRFQF